VILLAKINCWEFKKCGRGINGANVGKLGLCPAAREKRLDGTHGGKNGGRACWVIAGTLCDCEVQGTFASKIDHCFSCDFYNKVKKEEHPDFEFPAKLINKLK
jgi:hypothetical protein